MHRSSDADIRAWGASTAVDSDEEDEGQERFGTEVLEQQRLLHSGSTPHAARERHSVGSAAWANALYQRRAVRKGAQDRRALLVACCVLLGLGFGYALAGRWQRVGSGPNAAARVEAQLQPEAAARSAAPRLGPPPTIDPARWKHVLNESLQWADASVPAFECSDDDVTLTYWYRWRLFHLHMRRGDKLSACSSPRLGCWVRTEARLRPGVVEAATLCTRGCNPVQSRLQPHLCTRCSPSSSARSSGQGRTTPSWRPRAITSWRGAGCVTTASSMTTRASGAPGTVEARRLGRTAARHPWPLPLGTGSGRRAALWRSGRAAHCP